VKTNWTHEYLKDVSKVLPYPGKEVETEKVLVAYWDLPENSYVVTEDVNMQTLLNLPSFKGDIVLRDWINDSFYCELSRWRNFHLERLKDEESLYYHLPKELENKLPLDWEPVLYPTTQESDQISFKVERT
jgi:hypothetical protein